MLAELLASNPLFNTVAAAAFISGGALYAARKVRGARHTSKRMIYGPSKLNEFISKSLQPALDQYAPTWWTNTHMQIVLTFLVPQADLRYKRELLDLDDGGQAALDWAHESSTNSVRDLVADAPIVVVLHGLTGCSAAMRSLCAEALDRGYRPVVFNKRGHGGVKLTTPKLQAFGCVRDLQQAIAHIERAYPSAKLYGVGFSAGSGLLCSYLGETGAQSRLEAGVMISPGYNALDLFCGGKIHPVYDFLMTFSLKQFLSRHINELQDVIHVPSALKASSIREFDEHVFMKMHGYEDIETYWKYNNPMREADRIQRPTLCINALDDPVCTKENIPYEEFKVDPLRVLIETAHGSHCAFYEGHVVLKSWALGVAMDYLTKVREFQGRVPPAQ